ncbi:2-amino-4-hydroxy-6-hydroxymethyldihydropteridine diphosphokinase [Balneicella halophila]|uniref:2-amino-4-hydroxy-6-hydroxymethyldihydropteridine pyrophosphokinase n=1 Tax=Balneicella halophila TaxID=1537566 RepID=A0A7L4UPY3_BALHA|nr:2-amino-4-hydroxy-6-hydroxymethyldihydropteridine diphosphokinase [Balneicella halophila]PVX50103.1 2-amino-4-hydroxy-6-hydroxymethyldihydropteridine diphosphokinase [Balneicella halophila]
MYQFSHTAFLLLGSNQGDRKLYLKNAVCSISSTCGDIVTQSSYFFSESWGYEDENYINLAIELRTELSPTELLKATQLIEKDLGRTSKTTDQYEARPIDIDILFYDEITLATEQLILPHPRLHLRNFVIQPLQEIAPNFIHPVLHQSITELAKNSTDDGKVWRE